jgi:hypothetical protein
VMGLAAAGGGTGGGASSTEATTAGASTEATAAGTGAGAGAAAVGVASPWGGSRALKDASLSYEVSVASDGGGGAEFGPVIVQAMALYREEIFAAIE